MTSIKDDRGYNQGFRLGKSTIVRMQRRADWILSEMDDLDLKSILEIGCGTGEVAYWLAKKGNAQVFGTDLCVPFIEEARKQYRLPNLHYSVLDFNTGDRIEGAPFDYIVGNGILHHLYYRLDEVFARMSHLLKSGGKIIFMEPNYYNPYIHLIFSYPLLRRYVHLEPDEMAFPKNFVVDRLKRAGFTDVQVDYRDFLLPGIPDFLIRPSIAIGNVLEKTPLLRNVSQSIFIRAVKK